MVASSGTHGRPAAALRFAQNRHVCDDDLQLDLAHLSVPDVEPANMNAVVNFADVQRLLLAFQGAVYPFGPADADGNCS